MRFLSGHCHDHRNPRWAACSGVGDVKKNWGHLLLAIDPELLGDREQFIRKTTLIERVKRTKRLPGVEEIFVPGERGNRLTRQARAAGTIEIEEKPLEGLRKAAE